jgi:hypothetical protein
MNRIKWVDKANMIACVECGIIGSDLDAELKKYNVCTGHEPVFTKTIFLGFNRILHIRRLDFNKSIWNEKKLLWKY